LDTDTAGGVPSHAAGCDGRGRRTNFYKWDPEENIIRWAWVQFHQHRKQNRAAMADGTWSHAEFHRLRSPAEVEQFVLAADSL